MAEPDPQDSLDAATRATRSLQGLSTELTARVPQLLEAMRSVGAGLELHSTLDRICETAAELAHARYAAIGVVDELGEGLSDFVTYGVPQEVAEAIGRRPDGHRGLLPGRGRLRRAHARALRAGTGSLPRKRLALRRRRLSSIPHSPFPIPTYILLSPQV